MMAQQVLYRFHDRVDHRTIASRGTIFDVRHGNRETTPGRLPLEIELHSDIDALEAEWRALEENSNISIYQRFDWIRASINTIDKNAASRPLIVSIRENGKLVILLPFLKKGRIISRLIWIGGKHSNYNMAIIEREFKQRISSETYVDIFKQLAKMLPGVGYVKLCCQPLRWEEEINPLLALRHQHSTNTAFSMDLSGGFEHALAFGNAKRKRKKYRYQCREVKKHGNVNLLRAKNEAEINSILTEFYRQKSLRFAKLGMRDVFADEDAKSLISELALKSLTMDTPILTVYALEVGGQYRAIIAGGTHAGRFSACFSSFREDELSYISPGEMMLYLLAEKFCTENYQSFDLGAGDERYKRSWCSERIDMFDVVVPFSIWSVPIVLANRWFLLARRIIRANNILWGNFKQSRINWKKIHRKIWPNE